MFNHLPPIYKGIVLALGGFTCYAFCDICIKWLTPHYPIFQILATEFAIACLIVLAFSKHLGGTKDLFARKNRKIHLMRIATNIGISLSVTYCFSNLPIASVYIMIFTMPFIAAVLSIPLYGEKISWRRWLAIAIGFGGVIVAFRPDPGDIDPLLLIGLFASVLIALLYILSRSLHEPSIFSMGFAPLAGTFLFMLFPAIFYGVPFNPAHIPVFVLAGTLSAIGMMCVSNAFRLAPSAVVSPFLYTEIIWGFIFGYILFGDIADFWMIAGAVLIIGSGIFVIENERRDNRRKKLS